MFAREYTQSRNDTYFYVEEKIGRQWKRVGGRFRSVGAATAKVLQFQRALDREYRIKDSRLGEVQ